MKRIMMMLLLFCSVCGMWAQKSWFKKAYEEAYAKKLASISKNSPTASSSSSSTSSSSNQSSSSSTSSTQQRQLLAKGTYTISSQGRSATTGQYTGFAGPDFINTIEIYNDEICVTGTFYPFVGMVNGKRKYQGKNGFGGCTSYYTYYVDSNFNITHTQTLYSPYGSDTFYYTVEKGEVSIPKYSNESTSASYSNGGGYNVSSRSNGNSNNGNSRLCKKLSASDKAHCNGSGDCQVCNGKGRYYSSSYGYSGWKDCSHCNKSGKCPSCGGTGRRR